jgi:hypothetical protein
MAGASADISVVITGSADPASAQATATSGKKQRIRAKAGKQRITESDDSKKMRLDADQMDVFERIAQTEFCWRILLQ